MVMDNTPLDSLRREYRKQLRELRRAATDFAPDSDERFERLRFEAKRFYVSICDQELDEVPDPIDVPVYDDECGPNELRQDQK